MITTDENKVSVRRMRRFHGHVFTGLLVAIMIAACSVKQETVSTPTLSVSPTLTTVPLVVPTRGIVPTLVFTATPEGNVPPTSVVVPTRTSELPTSLPPATTDPNTNIPLTATNIPPTTSAPDALVSAGNTGLRLRSAPNTNSQILRNLNELTSLMILGRSVDGLWINVLTQQGDAGWIMTQFVDLSIDLNTVAIVDTGQIEVAAAPQSNNSGAVIADGQVVAEGSGVNLRVQPSTNSTSLTTLPEFTYIDIVGRTPDNAWLQVKSPAGLTGWVWGAYVQVNIDITTVSIPADAYEPTPAFFTQPDNVASGAVSGVTSGSANIFIEGQKYGNRPDVFSKIGDSITATGHFMYSFGWGRYNLHEYSYLQPVINFFSSTTAYDSNSFSNSPLAAKSGWKSSTVLDPANANPSVCLPGESPLVCEYRVVRPSLSIIMLGTNDMETNTNTYEANMIQIVETSIQMGVIPILCTIPARDYWDGKVAAYNQIIRNIAQTYDIPLVDVYSALINLPNRGLNSDGVHPAWIGGAYENYDPSGDFTPENLQYGFPMRNLVVLQMLDTVWRQVIAANEYTGPVIGSNTSGLNTNTTSNADFFSGSFPQTSNSNNTSLSCSSAPPTRLTVNGLGRVTPGLANNLRSTPSLSGQNLGDIPPGAVFTVLEGPTCSDGLNYWMVNYNGQIGWTAEGKGNDYWLEPL
jgi:Bacterial SH3 domain/GDSL-like Lipase/Acylhydrolase family